jgi:glutamyl-tRNA(Gln) amidotransferase subunit E
MQIALLLNCEIPDEIHVMRKTVIDGSNTTSFQRTAIVGINGFIRYKGKKIGIKNVCLEEDAAAIVSEKNGMITYRLNRLGIPLVEIATGIIKGFKPEDIEEIAFHIGMTCKSTKKTKRGIGSIRQDINISIKNGARVEVKGVQELGLLSKIIKNEVLRQLSLIEIQKELKKRRVRRLPSRIFNVTNLVKNTRNPVLKKLIEDGNIIYAFRLPKFSGLLKRELCPGKTLGKELAEVAKAYGIGGIFHSDEDLIRNFLFDDFKRIREYLRASIEDAIVLVGEKGKGDVAKKILERCEGLLHGPREETRAALEDGTTRFTRPLPGASRMYPETDVVPVLITKEELKSLKENLPEPWVKKLRRFKKYRLSSQLARQILQSDYVDLFEKIVKKTRAEPSIVASTFTSTIKDLKKREKIKIENLTRRHFIKIFEFLRKRKIVKEAIPEILKYLAKNPKASIIKAIKELNLKPIPKKQLIKIVKEVTATPMINFDKAVGLVMSKVRGRADAQEVIKLVKRFLRK